MFTSRMITRMINITITSLKKIILKVILTTLFVCAVIVIVVVWNLPFFKMLIFFYNSIFIVIVMSVRMCFYEVIFILILHRCFELRIILCCFRVKGNIINLMKNVRCLTFASVCFGITGKMVLQKYFTSYQKADNGTEIKN